MLQGIGNSLAATATVKSVFGDPIHSEGKTVVPVAKVAYGFGAGFGQGKSPQDNKQGEGGGGGGGVTAFPAGALEITAKQTRFIPLINVRLVIAAFTAGALLGRMIWHRR